MRLACPQCGSKSPTDLARGCDESDCPCRPSRHRKALNSRLAAWAAGYQHGQGEAISAMEMRAEAAKLIEQSARAQAAKAIGDQSYRMGLADGMRRVGGDEAQGLLAEAAADFLAHHASEAARAEFEAWLHGPGLDAWLDAQGGEA